MIDGVAYWVNGWIKQDKNGKQYLSMAFKRKDAAAPAQRADHQNERPAPQVARRASADMDDDSIPF